MHRKKLMSYMTILVMAASTLTPSVSVSATSNNSVSAIEISNGVDEANLTVTPDTEEDNTEVVEETKDEEDIEEVDDELYPLSDKSFFDYDFSKMTPTENYQYIKDMIQLCGSSNINEVKKLYSKVRRTAKTGDMVFDGKSYGFMISDKEIVRFSYPMKSEVETYEAGKGDVVYEFSKKAESKFQMMEAMTYESMIEQIIEDYMDSLTKAQLDEQRDKIVDNVVAKEYKSLEKNSELSAGDVLKLDNIYYFYIGNNRAMNIDYVSQTDYSVSFSYHEMNLNDLKDVDAAELYTYNKKDYTFIVPSPKSEYLSQLKDIELPDGFTWNSPDTKIVNVGNITYTATYTPQNTIKYKTETSVPITVNVAPKKITNLEAPVITKKYTYDPKMKLSDIELPTDWEWVDGNENPKPNKSQYQVRFNPEFLEGYDIQTSSRETVTNVTIEKANVAIDKLAYTVDVNSSTADIKLPTSEYGTYTWNNSKIFNTKGTFTLYVTFTPYDTTCYETITNIPVTVKVDSAADEQIPEKLTAIYGQKLHEVALPAGWEWITPNADVGDVGENPFYATYEYNTYELYVKVSPAKGMSPKSPENIIVVWKKGMELAKIDLPIGWSFKANQKLKMGNHSYKVTYEPNDDKNYDWSESTLDSAVQINVKQAVPNYKSPGTISVTSGSTLNNKLLPTSDDGKYTWTSDTSKKIKSNGTYYCKFTPNDKEHYYIVTDIAVVVTVIKSTKTSEKNNTTSKNNSATTAPTATAQRTANNSSRATTTSSTSSSSSSEPDNDHETTEDKKDMSDVKIVANADDQRTYKVRPTVVSDSTPSSEVQIKETPKTEETDTTETNITTEESTRELISEEATTEEGNNQKKSNPFLTIIKGLLLLIIISITGAIGVVVYMKKKENSGINLVNEDEE